jgi:hypothetical protein
LVHMRTIELETLLVGLQPMPHVIYNLS